jgi:hypothetical protein
MNPWPRTALLGVSVSKVARKQKRGQADKQTYAGGYLRLRRGILQHLDAGTISLLDFSVYVWLMLKADYKTGLAWGCAEKIRVHASRGTSLRAIQRSIDRLEHIGWLKRWRTHGQRGNYPILIARFSVFYECVATEEVCHYSVTHTVTDASLSVSLREHRVNIERTTDYNDIQYDHVTDSVTDVTPSVSPLSHRGVTDDDTEASPNKELRTKDSKKKEKPDADNNSHRTNRGDAASETKSNHQPKIDAVILSWIHGRILESARQSQTEITNRRAYLRKGTAEFLKHFDSELIGYLHELVGVYVKGENTKGKRFIPYEDIIAHIRDETAKHHLPVNHTMILDAIETASIEYGFTKISDEPKPPDQPDQKPN